ncbi:MAG: SMC-Scp complex subunit ScpB [Pseudomonadota bacterium]
MHGSDEINDTAPTGPVVARDNVISLPGAREPTGDTELLRALEAQLFLAAAPLREAELARLLGVPAPRKGRKGARALAASARDVEANGLADEQPQRRDEGQGQNGGQSDGREPRPGDPAPLTPHAPAHSQPSPLPALLRELQRHYANRGINLVKRGDRWAFVSAADLSGLLRQHAVAQRRLSRAALETLAIIAYHQPVTRAEVEEVRGVATAKGVLDTLMEQEWVTFRGRCRSPGRPMTYGVAPAFMEHFGLESLDDLPGLQELKRSGLLSDKVPANFQAELALGLEGLSDAALDAGYPEEDGPGDELADEPPLEAGPD